MVTRRSVDQLGGDANAVTRPAHASLDQIAHPQFPTDLLHGNGPPLVAEGGIARDDEEIPYAAQRGGDVFDHAVSEIILLGVAAHILERQDR
jgi:hypothetical protein